MSYRPAGAPRPAEGGIWTIRSPFTSMISDVNGFHPEGKLEENLAYTPSSTSGDLSAHSHIPTHNLTSNSREGVEVVRTTTRERFRRHTLVA